MTVKSPISRTVTGKNGTKPGAQLANLLIFALRIILPYALPVGALCSFVYAGFLYSTIVGFVVLGICLLAVHLDQVWGDR